jgi:hypothetical protein
VVNRGTDWEEAKVLTRNEALLERLANGETGHVY